jgi:protocatechuate 3,4-dioxygenase alpha subunit
MVLEEQRPVLEPTLSQTVGPFFHLGLGWLFNDRVAAVGAPGPHIIVQGQILDGDGLPVSDALLEVWQADASGRYVLPAGQAPARTVPGFTGYARIPTDDAGAFRIETVKPGRVPAPESGLQAPHISVQLFMRGLLRPLLTRIYFADEASNEGDLVLDTVPASRRSTLLALPRAGEPGRFDWNVVLQGPHETVFFDG